MLDTDRPTVLILTGPPGAGKTTVARLLTQRYERSVLVESDHFFEAIASGYIAPWKTESHQQNQVVMRIVGEAAAGYSAAGYFTVLDGIVIPGWFFETLRDALDARSVAVSYAVLRPPLAVCIDRSNQRQGSRLSDRGVIEHLWSSFSDLGRLEKHVIDNGEQDAGSTATVLHERLQRGSLSTEP